MTLCLEMHVHWESQLLPFPMRKSETSSCAHEGCGYGSCLPQNVLGGNTKAVGMQRPAIV